MALGRLNIRERHHRLNILTATDINFVLCNNGIESFSHLFFTCEFSWKAWQFCCNWWGIDWVVSDNLQLNFNYWFLELKGDCRKVWLSGFYVIIWCVWDLRNKVIFQNQKVRWVSFMRGLMEGWKFWISYWHNNRSISSLCRDWWKLCLKGCRIVVTITNGINFLK